MTEKKELSRDELLKKLSKNKTSAERGLNDKKSNVELGKELDLYVLNEVVGSGLPLLTPKGTTIKRELERFIIDEELKRGYQHTSTPIMAKSDLYKISGHWEHYKDSMFSFDVGGDILALRPMTCPFHFVLYKQKPRTYKELPIKYAEVASLFRNEKSGELRGLTRVRQFTLADAHIICMPKQVEEEFRKVLELINLVMKSLGVDDTWYRFSKWDPKDTSGKYVNDPEAWEKTQKILKDILDRLQLKYVEEEGEAAFYGPKLDLQYKDVYGKEDTLITLQIDFALPEKFDLKYTDEEGKEQKPMVIHRSSLGATERIMAHVLELTQGKLPLWLSPTQVKILPINEKNGDYANSLACELIQKNVRTEVDSSNESIGKKIRKATIEKVNYILIIGDKEVENKVISVRDREGNSNNDVNFLDFIKSIEEDIKLRKFC